MTTEEYDKAKDEYWEAVTMFVDGIIGDIVSGHAESREQAQTLLEEGVGQERYVFNEDLAMITLYMSMHPCAFITVGISGDHNITDAFPWSELAHDAFTADASLDLLGRAEYLALPDDSLLPEENSDAPFHIGGCNITAEDMG